MFEKILIANRGEIAAAGAARCKELGIPTVAVHSTADADAMHVRLADESVCIGRRPRARAISTFPALLAACEITGADAVASGYGFLSENARCRRDPGRARRALHRPAARAYPPDGRQIEAKRTAKRLGIPVVPARMAASAPTPMPPRSRAPSGFRCW